MSKVTVTGVVQEGVEHGSFVLIADPGAPESCYQIGGAGQDYVGRRVELIGQLEVDVVSIAMQGVLVQVDEIKPLDDNGEPTGGK